VPTATRVRRAPDVAREEILDAAERRLVDGGPEAVRVQLVARDVGLTDAAVHYHFGSREGLLEALLRRAGRRLKGEIREATRSWDADTLDVGKLVAIMERIYGAGYARLSVWLQLAGWKPRGSGMLTELAERMHDVRQHGAGRRLPLEDTLFTVELLTLVVWADAFGGDAWRRSVGLPTDQATRKRFLDWFASLVEEHIACP
jgi:AcrR family transcriptional regulator